MKNKPTPEQEWVERTLRSLEGAARPVPSPWLYQQVRHRLAARRAPDEVPARGWVLARLALAGALVAVNAFTIAYRADMTTSAQPEAAAQEYAYPTLGGY